MSRTTTDTSRRRRRCTGMHPAFRAIFAGLILGAPFAVTAAAGAEQPSCSLAVTHADDTTMTVRYVSGDGVARTVWANGHPTTLADGASATIARVDNVEYPQRGTWWPTDWLMKCGGTTTTTTTSSTTTTSTTAPPSTTTTAVSPTTVTAPTTVVTATTPQPSTSLPPATSTSVEQLPPVTVPGVPTTVGLPRLPETGRNTSSALLLGGVLAVSGVAALVAQRMVDREND